MSKISDFFYNGLNCEVAGKALDARQGIALMQTFNQFGESLSELGSRVSAVEGAGGGIAGTSYIYVAGKGSADANAQELQNAYNAAKAMQPYGAALSATNRVKIVVGSGTYNFTLNVDTQFIDIISLTGECDIKLTGINVSVNDVYLRGIDVGVNQFSINGNLNLLICEKCNGGMSSFGQMYNTIVSGTFINCVGGIYSFGGFGGSSSGKFINCKGDRDSFGGHGGIASGIFINCTGGDTSFGDGSASGTFENCKGAAYSFGRQYGVSGTLINCAGGQYSFGNLGGISNTALLFNCRLISGSYPTPAAGGLIRNCLDGNKAIINT